MFHSAGGRRSNRSFEQRHQDPRFRGKNPERYPPSACQLQWVQPLSPVKPWSLSIEIFTLLHLHFTLTFTLLLSLLRPDWRRGRDAAGAPGEVCGWRSERRGQPPGSPAKGHGGAGGGPAPPAERHQPGYWCHTSGHWKLGGHPEGRPQGLL